jgi:type II secretory pathway pseudopilin PulG
MRNLIDFSSWSALLTTLVGMLLATLLMVGVRLVFMQTMQRRRERENRQINERLKTLIAAYKTLGGSFTGQLQVSPAHMRDLRSQQARHNDAAEAATADLSEAEAVATTPELASTERQRRMRDAVEAALSDVILLGTEEQVELAARAARMKWRRDTTSCAVSMLRPATMSCAALDLEAIPASVAIPNQGPLRPAGGAGGAAGKRAGVAGRADAGGGRGGGGGGAGGAGGAGLGAMAAGAGVGSRTADVEPPEGPGR